MWQVQFSRAGAPQDVVELADVAAPDAPAAGEVLVRVLAFPINPADLLTMSGLYAGQASFPARLGNEAVGVVEEIGEGVRSVGPGDRVIFLCRDNWAELRLVAEHQVVRVSGTADLSQLAMLKVNPATASLMLSRFESLRSGDWIIQSAGRSAVGRCLVQLVRQSGIRVISVVRRAVPEPDDEAEVVLGDGPDLVDRVRALVGSSLCKLAVDAVGGETTMRMADCLATGGTVVGYGGLDGGAYRIRPDQIIFRDIKLRGFWLTRYVETASRPELDRLYSELAKHVEDRSLQIPVAAQYPPREIREAVVHAGGSARDGKILIVV